MAKSRIIGAKSHTARLRKLAGEKMVREVGRALYAAGEMIQVEAQIGISSGSVSGKNHVPAPPGSYPNQDTGVLASSIETNQVAPLVVEVSANAPYSAPLEFGTSKMAARPFMSTARDAKKAEVTQLIRRAVDRAVKKSKSSEG